jgi:uncharacterized cupredoxin-like copper-binding protein
MRRLAIVAPLVVLLAGCGSSASTSTSTTTAPPAAASSTSTSSSIAAGAPAGSLTLSETEFKITPKTDTVASAGKVTITVKNNGKIVHALAVQTPAGVVKTGNIAPGATATLTVDLAKAGSYTFYCPIDGHRGLGMVGTLTVGGGGGSASSGGASAASSSSTTTTSTASSGGAPAY